jgi:SPP1 gp7 family putative phage head morphogenesis protein
MSSDNLEAEAARHSIYVQRFGGYLANLFDPYSQRLKRELRSALLDGPETTTNLKLINRLINEYRGIALSIYGEYNDKDILAELEEFSAAEGSFVAKSINDALISSAPKAVAPASVQLWAAIKAEPLVIPGSNGVNLLTAFISTWEKKRVDIVSDQIRTGFMTGRTSQQIARDIAGKGGFLDVQNKRSIKTLVTTSTNHVSNTARQKVYESNSDIIRAYKIVATLDGVTSDTCRGYDGKVVSLKDEFQPMPPFHPGCRTTTVPVPFARFTVDDGQGTRASKGVEGGQQVPSKETYYEWLRGQGSQGPKGRAFVQDVLGKERADLFLDGGLSVTKFKQLTMDELFRPISLDVLKSKASLQSAFDKI